MSAGAASVPVPEAMPQARRTEPGPPGDSRHHDAAPSAGEGFADVLTAIADEGGGPPGDPPEETPATTARTATAEGQEDESDSLAPTGIEQALAALAAAVTSASGETLEAAPAKPSATPAPQQDEPGSTAAGAAIAAPAERAQAASSLPGTGSPTAAAGTKQPAGQAQEPPTAALVASQGEGQRRLDGKPASTPHRRTPVQSASGPAADAAANVRVGSQAPDVPAAPAAGQAQVDDARGAARPVPSAAAAHAQAGSTGEPAGTAVTTATAVRPIPKDAPGTPAPAHDTPRTVTTEATQVEQPAATPPVGETRPVDPGGKAAAAAPHGRTQLHELVAHVRETIRVTVREERTEARITLHPAELGEVRIRISYGPGGISASIVADSSRAAQTLAQSTPELRRTLEEHGVTLQSVAVHVGGEGAQLGSENGPGGAAAGSEGDTRREPTGDAPAEADEAHDPNPTRDAPLGAYVDVLA